ncbi:MAG TPA: NAD(P)-dependent alcohol dehydrogenase [Microlunatus sp.]
MTTPARCERRGLLPGATSCDWTRRRTIPGMAPPDRGIQTLIDRGLCRTRLCRWSGWALLGWPVFLLPVDLLVCWLPGGQSGRYCAGMQAAVQTRYGSPDVVGVVEVDKPTIGDAEILVQVHATTVNRTDCACRAAKPFFMRLFTGLIRPRATILGNEFAGKVAEVGGGVSAFSVGDNVFGYNEGPFGAHAQYLAIPADGSVTTMPANLSYVEAAPSTEGSHYALAHIRGAKITAGQDVLVYGATGAIGTAAVQLLKSLGVTVTAVCDTANMNLVDGLGADRVIDYTTTDFTKDDQTYDVVLDSVGKSSFSQCRPLLKPAGIYISSELGPYAQNPFLALLAPLQRGTKVMFPIPKHDQQMIQYFSELTASGQFKPVIDRTYPLDQIVQAYRYVETGQKVGNVVITVEHSD